MGISIIIVTYNRPDDLEDCLNSILIQSLLPYEALIIDNSVNEEVKKLIEKKKQEFRKIDIPLKYIKNEKENSLTIAKNIGTKNATGDIILFLDDDIVLEKDCLKELLAIYRNYPNAVGAQGHIVQEKPSKIRNFLYKIFYLYHLEKNKCRVLPSAFTTYPLNPQKIISCQWLSGASSYGKEIFEEFFFNEKLKKYSDGEDLEFSYRVFKKHPNSLYMNPRAKLIHKTSPVGRTSGKEIITMREVYGLYLFYKLIPQTIKNKLIFFWSRVGRFVTTAIRIIKRPPGIMSEIKHLIGAYFFCLFHLKEIKKGDLEFFNKTLLK